MSNKLGNKIKEIRLEQGMSQDEFAKELGYTSKSTVNKIEKGVNDMSYDKLELLIQKFDLEVNELFDSLAKDANATIYENNKIYKLSVPVNNTEIINKLNSVDNVSEYLIKLIEKDINEQI